MIESPVLFLRRNGKGVCFMPSIELGDTEAVELFFDRKEAITEKFVPALRKALDALSEEGLEIMNNVYPLLNEELMTPETRNEVQQLVQEQFELLSTEDQKEFADWVFHV